MPPFVSLSPELVFSICEKLPLTDLKQLRLSCKAIGRTADSLVLRKLRISAETATLDESISYLQSFAQSPARYITQDILIEDLSSLSSGTNDSERELIMEALASLTAVRRVSWRTNQKDCLWIQETIWSVIQSFSTLRDLHIDIQFLQLSPTFKALTSLETISIDASACSKTSWLYTSLSKLYASCPTLTSLAISDGSGHHSLTKENSLDQIFLECSKDVLPGRLCRLCLRGCFVRIDNITLPHLRQLTSLELICTQRRYSAGELDYYGGPLDIWSTFIGSGIQLEELVHNTTTTPLFDYLSSYSGLKKLELSVSPFADASSSDEAATRFFDDVLSRHLETLESLSLEACYEGEWCFTPRNAGLISHCTKLNHLLMGIISDKTPRAFNASPVKHLLDIVIQLPLMRHLSLVPATPEYERDCYRCGNGIMNHFRLTKDQIMRDVTIYQPPHSCSYLLEVEVSGNAFKSVRDAARGHRRHVRFVSDLKNPRIRQ